MKKIVFLFVFVMHVFALKAETLAGGLRAGLNFIQLSALGWQNDYQTSPFAGAFVTFNISHRLGVNIEANYATQTVKTDTSFKGLFTQYYTSVLDSNKKGEFVFNRIQVPLTLNFKFSRRFWLQGGVIFSNSTNIIDKNSFVKTADKVFASQDVSALGGIWLGITNKLSIQGRYAQSMSDLNKLKDAINNPNVSTTKNWKNQYIQIGVGYKLF